MKSSHVYSDLGFWYIFSKFPKLGNLVTMKLSLYTFSFVGKICDFGDVEKTSKLYKILSAKVSPKMIILMAVYSSSWLVIHFWELSIISTWIFFAKICKEIAQFLAVISIPKVAGCKFMSFVLHPPPCELMQSTAEDTGGD